MNDLESPENIKETIDKTHKNSGKLIPRFLKFINKIDSVAEYDTWIKETNITLFDWFFEYLIIKSFLIFFCLSALFPPPTILIGFLKAEGISILWFLITELKKDLFRKGE